ncbi:MAG: DUF2975 domain-containing protein [Bacillota bacterium]
MKKGTTLFLRGAVLVMALPILTICILWLPAMYGYFNFSMILGAYGTAMAYFFALYQTFKLINYIDQNRAFSRDSVTALGLIKYAAVVISGIYIVMLPFLYPIADADDAPGVVGFPIIIVFASLVIATFAAVLQKLLAQAIEIKEENDLVI